MNQLLIVTQLAKWNYKRTKTSKTPLDTGEWLKDYPYMHYLEEKKTLSEQREIII